MQNPFGQPLRSRRVRDAAIEHRLDHGTAAAQCVSDHHDIGPIIQLLRTVALRQLDPEGLELVAHGRINVAIRSRDAKSGGLGNGGHASHEGPGDPQDVHVLSHEAGTKVCSRNIDSNKYPTLMMPPSTRRASRAARQMFAQASRYQMRPTSSNIPTGSAAGLSAPMR